MGSDVQLAHRVVVTLHWLGRGDDPDLIAKFGRSGLIVDF